MARGSIIWRCRRHGNKTSGSCDCPGGSYAIAYTLGGKRKWETISRIKKDAERRLAEVLSQLHQGTYRVAKPPRFQEFSQRWLHDYAEGAVKLMTLRAYRWAVRAHLDPTFGGVLLTQISPGHVQGFVAACLREKHLSPKTTNNLLMVLKLMLGHAKQWGLLPENPAAPIKPVRLEPREMDFLKPDEIQLLLQHADEPHRTLFLTAILTGMRRGELIGLQWGDIDWHNNVIHVRRSLLWHNKEELSELEGNQKNIKWQFSMPKSKRSVRTITMTPRLREALELHRLACPRSVDDLVFCTKEGTPLDPNNMVKRHFLPALSRAELRHIRFHDLRHTYTTLLIAQGVNVKAIQAQLGHASIQTTLDRYGHLLPENQQHVGERLDAQVFGERKERANAVLTERARPAAPKSNRDQHVH